MAGSYPQPERDEAFYLKIMARDAEVIEAQDKHIAKLNVKINQLRQKIKSMKRQNNV